MTNPNQFSPPPIDRSSALAEWKPPEHTSRARQDPSRSAWISAQARLVFGSYRKDDFADPDGFLIQLGMVLERYSDQVIADICDPRSGIQRRCKFPPSVAEIVEACDNEVIRAARIKRFSDMGQVRRFDWVPQHRANVFVPGDNPLYPMMVEKARTGDTMEFRYDAGGIWVALGWMPEEGGRAAVAHEFKRFTVDDLAALYKRNEAAE